MNMRLKQLFEDKTGEIFLRLDGIYKRYVLLMKKGI